MRTGPWFGLLLLLLPTTSLAGPFDTFRPGKPLVLELDGRFAPDRETARAGGVDPVSVQLGTRTRWFGAVTARTTSGDPPPVSGRTVLSALAPIHPNLLARGAADLVRRLRDAPDGALVHMDGLIDRGSHTYLLRLVEVETTSLP